MCCAANRAGLVNMKPACFLYNSYYSGVLLSPIWFFIWLCCSHASYLGKFPSPVHHRTNASFTPRGNLESPNMHVPCFWSVGGNQNYLEKTHTGKGRTCTLHVVCMYRVSQSWDRTHNLPAMFTSFFHSQRWVIVHKCAHIPTYTETISKAGSCFCEHCIRM